MAAVCRLSKLFFQQNARYFQRLQVSNPTLRNKLPTLQHVLLNSTTSKSDQAAISSEFVVGKGTEVTQEEIDEVIRRGEEDLEDPAHPDYVKHGFHEDPYSDRIQSRLVFFGMISLAMVLGSLFIHYTPDPKGREWGRREAKVVLQERREQGLPLIDPNFCPPEKVFVPTDEWIAEHGRV
ncbi:NADH dehydrogenase [ubiquinone] 1 beta subcomplex subunit 11, mitochondrial-like [Anneissia japonica]|uniref:NADH dehydrogenase [ubiquinone] 1 beta subcomplex subunit 11, mitochondrial-like n=1 Tax=Anneissia japonica TaxID=1529436 RepID=UPI001425A99D|nr:NADH dehydrogenase [ubiquinone] 1 beta subcomplex subunit 11, mitochondrial-like [Anneissia japonica]